VIKGGSIYLKMTSNGLEKILHLSQRTQKEQCQTDEKWK
jgi:uncharacterized membrane protein